MICMFKKLDSVRWITEIIKKTEKNQNKKFNICKLNDLQRKLFTKKYMK